VWTTVIVGAIVCAAPAAAQRGAPYPLIRAYESSARLQVTPKETEVYVDGYFAGIADDFDGMWQRLRMQSGEHDITLFLAGHRTFTEKLLFRPGQTLTVRHEMEAASPGEVAERPKPAAEPAVVDRGANGPMPTLPRRVPQPSTFGTLALRVVPADADIFVDGERWTIGAGETQLVLELADTTHPLEVRKDGYKTYTTTVIIRRGETTRMNVNLTR
jgi:hypothetical protein